MSRFKAKVTELTIYMDDDMFITTVSAPAEGIGATPNEAQIGDFHMSLFTVEEWDDLSKIIAQAVATVTETSEEQA